MIEVSHKVSHIAGEDDPFIREVLTKWGPDIQALDGDQAISVGLSFLFSVMLSVYASDKDFAKTLSKKIIKAISDHSDLLLMDSETVN